MYELHWHFNPAGEFIFFKLKFDSGDSAMVGTDNTPTRIMGGVSIERNKIYSSACYDTSGAIPPLLSAFRLDPSDGGAGVEIGGTVSSSCTPVTLQSANIIGIMLHSSKSYIKFLYPYLCSYTEDTSGATAYSDPIDLLSSATYAFVTLPTVTSTCGTASFELYRVDDSLDMTTTGNFAISGSDFTFTPNTNNFATRHDLMLGGTNFNLKRIFIETSTGDILDFVNFSFVVQFADACLSASLNDPAIIFPDVTWNMDWYAQATFLF